MADAKRKGSGKAGGGLAARVKEWEAMSFPAIAPNIKRDNATGYCYRRPGSERKGNR